jgi:TIGR00268 family protein
MQDYQTKIENLKKKMTLYAEQDIVVAFSGGADSGLLLKMACEAAEKTGHIAYGIYLHTMLHPSGEAERAGKLADEMGASFKALKIDELYGADIEYNPKDRCYRCKRYLFECILKEAERLHAGVVMEGTNLDDTYVYRPGIRAVKELGIASPLMESGLTKEEVRRLAAEYGLSVSDKPAAPCLATRFPYGTRLSDEAMRRVEQAERFLKEQGFYNVRLRVHGDIARIEVDSHDLQKLVEKRIEIIRELKALGYTYVTMDLEGFRSGSMDVNIKV